jgi:hypothetical protein
MVRLDGLLIQSYWKHCGPGSLGLRSSNLRTRATKTRTRSKLWLTALLCLSQTLSLIKTSEPESSFQILVVRYFMMKTLWIFLCTATKMFLQQKQSHPCYAPVCTARARAHTLAFPYPVSNVQVRLRMLRTFLKTVQQFWQRRAEIAFQIEDKQNSRGVE